MLEEQGLLGENADERCRKRIDEQNTRYLMVNGLIGSASINAGEDIEKYADQNGCLTVPVYYIVDVCEEERGDGIYVPCTNLCEQPKGLFLTELNYKTELPRNMEKYSRLINVRAYLKVS